ncbi:FxSxx-COOH cyclophane-containing RiPP peptide [Actinoplanes sp. NPDC049681]|uniref:FxSxx-COOH cyclophane-containing RiPP peptide n=1 Tax=Actinoplanes sp. NPDC049681 TaxID=3363905 RepID=UPI0037AF2C68
MDGGRSTTGATPEWRSAMIDVSTLSLTELAADAEADGTDESALGRCLRRLADELARPGEPIAGFNSAL